MEAVNLISSSKYSEKQIVRLINQSTVRIIDGPSIRVTLQLPC